MNDSETPRPAKELRKEIDNLSNEDREALMAVLVRALSTPQSFTV